MDSYVIYYAARLSKHSKRRTITRREVRSAVQLLRPKTHAAHQGA
uniref:Histone H2A/H2B/H3 domain-containing protein n=1 Tax=Paramormyrops kingsleyae TaxID=1676925 RepID=A0A3B3QGI2_9TELE